MQHIFCPLICVSVMWLAMWEIIISFQDYFLFFLFIGIPCSRIYWEKLESSFVLVQMEYIKHVLHMHHLGCFSCNNGVVDFVKQV